VGREHHRHGDTEVKIGELFAGVGGFGLAAERCGMTVVWASEIEAFPEAVHQLRFPAVRRIGDVTSCPFHLLP
jgi:DNA (cytosine-5)-methyltransferase 1